MTVEVVWRFASMRIESSGSGAVASIWISNGHRPPPVARFTTRWAEAAKPPVAMVIKVDE
jgi:hypothetical protein